MRYYTKTGTTSLISELPSHLSLQCPYMFFDPNTPCMRPRVWWCVSCAFPPLSPLQCHFLVHASLHSSSSPHSLAPQPSLRHSSCASIRLVTGILGGLEPLRGPLKAAYAAALTMPCKSINSTYFNCRLFICLMSCGNPCCEGFGRLMVGTLLPTGNIALRRYESKLASRLEGEELPQRVAEHTMYRLRLLDRNFC
jgi:hypothetical protein